jgi:hypothetical protein
MIDWFDVGDEVRLSVTFTNVATSAAVDPGAVALSVRAPNGTLTTRTYAAAEVIKTATGAYYYDLPVTAAGSWAWRWVGSGANAAAAEGSVAVRRSNFA